MKPLKCAIWSGRFRSLTPPAIWPLVLAGLFLLRESTAHAAGMVTICTEADLRTAMAGGGLVTFGCDGTITLGSTITNSWNTVLDGSGHQIRISGISVTRVFYNNTNVSFTLINLTIADGGSLGGSAILNLGGTVNLATVSFHANTANLYAMNDDFSPRAGGGAIFNRGGTVNATNCSFVGNVAQTPMDISTLWSPLVSGGAIRNETGQMTLRSCLFVGNRAAGGAVMFSGSGQNGDPGFGGAIHNSGMVTLDSCSFTSNSASGGTAASYPQWTGFSGSEGSGGAVFNEGTLTADRTSFHGNTATGGSGNWGGAIAGTLDGAPGGAGAPACGGAICNSGSLSISRSTFASNSVTGGGGGAGGNGIQYMDTGGYGGRGGNGGSGLGGALFNSGTASLINCTLAFNTGSGGSGGNGGAGAGGRSGASGAGGAGGNGGSGFGGVDGTCHLSNCTIARNRGTAGAGGAGGAGSFGNPIPGALGANGTAWGGTAGSTLANTLLASNTPGADDFFPNPKLGPLADNGGPTLTMALLSGSPAIDAGTIAGTPPTDQRDVVRPQGRGVDVGAYEFQFTIPQITSAAFPSASNFWLQVCGLPTRTYTLQSSTNLHDWSDVTNLLTGATGMGEALHCNARNCRAQFYRLKSPPP